MQVQDDKKENISAYFDEVTAKLEEVHLKGKGAAVVHCMVGVSRSASFVLGVCFLCCIGYDII